jgi:uncharacterized protein (DUF427 family)
VLEFRWTVKSINLSDMSLTKGSGPFGATPAGSFNFDPHPPEHVLYVERSPRRVRVMLGAETVADSTGVWLLHPPGRTPTYLFPREHVRTATFEPSDRRRFDPGMGEGTYWTVRVGDRRAVDAAYSFQDPPATASPIAGLIAFDWDAMAMLLESGPPARYYLPVEDVRTDLLQTSDTTTGCPYNGTAHYWSLRIGQRFEPDIVWSYPEPRHNAEAVGGLLSAGRVECSLDRGRHVA